MLLIKKRVESREIGLITIEDPPGAGSATSGLTSPTVGASAAAVLRASASSIGLAQLEEHMQR